MRHGVGLKLREVTYCAAIASLSSRFTLSVCRIINYARLNKVQTAKIPVVLKLLDFLYPHVPQLVFVLK